MMLGWEGLIGWIATHIGWSGKTFGPGLRSEGVRDHITKELAEIATRPYDLEEWIDIIILGFDGAWRTGASPVKIIEALQSKQQRNMSRKWPSKEDQDPNKAVEHIRLNLDKNGVIDG